MEEAGGAVNEVGEVAAGVGEDDLAVTGVVAEHVRGDHVDCCAACFVRVVVGGLGEVFVDQVGVHGVGWVDEYDGGAAVEKVPDRDEIWMAEVVVVFSVARKQDDAVRAEGVERVGHFFYRGLGVKEAWYGGEETVVLRMRVTESCVELIACSCETLCFGWIFLDVGAWSCAREDGGAYTHLLTEIIVGFDRPLGDKPAGWIASVTLECVSVDWRVDVVVDVDFVLYSCWHFENVGKDNAECSVAFESLVKC